MSLDLPSAQLHKPLFVLQALARFELRGAELGSQNEWRCAYAQGLTWFENSRFRITQT